MFLLSKMRSTDIRYELGNLNNLGEAAGWDVAVASKMPVKRNISRSRDPRQL